MKVRLGVSNQGESRKQHKRNIKDPIMAHMRDFARDNLTRRNLTERILERPECVKDPCMVAITSLN